MAELTKNQQIQEDQYRFPYHYADLISDKHKYFKYIEPLDLIRVVKDKVATLHKKKILDAGCGDGRLIYEIKGKDYELAGMDYSATAIGFARAFNPEVEFYNGDFRTVSSPVDFDIVILMEVLEHFIPAQIPEILQALSNRLKPDGLLLITVPSTNMKLSAKHYQHFNPESLAETIKPYFKIADIGGYAKKGAKRTFFYILRNWGNLFYPFRHELKFAYRYFAFYKKFYEKHLSIGKIEECNGILAVCQKCY
ncbi:MAG: class I SAM-dependent methyltransferase [Bacteroidales bacterium]